MAKETKEVKEIKEEVKLTKDELQGILHLFERVELRGAEVPSFNRLVSKINLLLK